MALKTPELIGIYGAGNLGRKLATLIAAPIVFVDDTPQKQGKLIDGVLVLSVEEFLKRTKRAENYVLYIGIWNLKFDFVAKQQELSAIGLKCLPFTRAVLVNNASLMFFEPRAKLLQKLSRYKKYASQLADDESRRALEGHLAFRQSGDFSDLVVDQNRFPVFLSRALCDNISYVDAGAYDGDTVADFITYSRGKFRQIIALEPDPNNFSHLQMRVEGYLDNRIMIMNVALSATCGEVSFMATGDMNAALCEFGNIKARGIQWEDIKVCSPAYYKLDIEGEEPAVICAAAKSIAQNQPLLSISVYHAPDDFLSIASTLLSLDVGYRLYLRCHEKEGADLMLYAIPQTV